MSTKPPSSGVAPTMTQFLELKKMALKTDQSFRMLNARVNTLDDRVCKLDERVSKLDDRVSKLDEKVTRVAASVARLEGDMFEVKRDVCELKGLHTKFDRFQVVLDGMAGQMQSFERWCRSQGSMLMEHEGRIAKLELRPQ